MIAFADLFCGAGGATTGVLLASQRRGITIRDGVAINHWPLAVETHSANHPNIRHLCEAIDKVDPCEAVPGGRLDLLWASPECTHFSRARGGRPKQNQSRSGASHILTWLDKLYVKNVIIENVPDFVTWGIKTKQNCALVNCFLTAAKDRGSFVINIAHGGNGKTELHRTSGLGEPVGTLTTKGQYGLTSFVLQLNGTSERHLKGTAHSIKEPLRAQTGSGHHALCSSFLIQYYSRSGAISVKEPCPTLSTRDRFLLVNAAANEKYELQIFFRLLKPKELAAVHSFPRDYKFAGNKTQQVKQIGNSNPVELTAALTSVVL